MLFIGVDLGTSAVKLLLMDEDVYKRQVIEWIGNGKLPTDGVVTHKFPLEKWEEGFHIAKTGENGALKVVLVPEMEA